MRDMSHTKKLILISLIVVAIVVLGFLFVIGGSVIGQVPNSKPVAVPSSTGVQPITQVKPQSFDTVAEIKDTDSQVLGTQTPTSNETTKTSSDSHRSFVGKVKKSLQNLF